MGTIAIFDGYTFGAEWAPTTTREPSPSEGMPSFCSVDSYSGKTPIVFRRDFTSIDMESEMSGLFALDGETIVYPKGEKSFFIQPTDFEYTIIGASFYKNKSGVMVLFKRVPDDGGRLSFERLRMTYSMMAPLATSKDKVSDRLKGRLVPPLFARRDEVLLPIYMAFYADKNMEVICEGC